MKGLYFYKLTSPYQEDVTKDCKLTINEIDHNFVTLKNTDIQDIVYDEETGLLTLSQINGDKFIAKIDLSHFTRDFNVEWDKENSALIFNFDGKEVKIDEFISTIVDNSVTNIVEEIISQTITDDTLVGVGIGKDPLGISPLEKPGTYKAVECLIDKIEGKYLPNEDYLKKGDRFLTREKLNLCGYLYDFDSVKKINEDLKEGWRVPTKEDWDNLLNAVELCNYDKNHDSTICNINVGKYAGKLLKYNDYWKVNESGETTSFVCDDGCMVCEGDGLAVNPDTSKGVDAYGFSVLPAGYGDAHGSLHYMGEQTEFWTMTETERTDVYTKRFYYNKANIVQIAESPYALCSVRLVKDYNGTNFRSVETINGQNYQTVLMPSENSENGYSIWIASNVAFDNERYNPRFHEESEIVIEDIGYYINEWNGLRWFKKRLNDGESLVIKVGPDGDNNREYRLIGNELINVKHELREELLDIVTNLDCETVGKEGDYVDSITEQNGVVSATTKTLVNADDKILTYDNDGIFSTLDLEEYEGDYENGVKRVYKLLDKNQEVIGSPIIVDENMTHSTYISQDIPVVGGPLAELFDDTTQIIKAGSNIQELLMNLFCKEKYPENPSFNEGSITAEIGEPLFNVYAHGTTTTISNNIEVEVGTTIDITKFISPKTQYIVSDSIWSGFDFGYSVLNNNQKDADGNPIQLNNTDPIQMTNYSLIRTFDGFDNKVFNQVADSNMDNTKVSVDRISNITIADGINTISSYVSGATFSTTFDAEILGYYACSNLENTKDEKFVSGYTHTKTTNLPTNSYSITIKGMRYSFIGTFENNDFVATSENIRRNLTKIAFNKLDTTKVKADSGKTCVVIAYPQEWGEIKYIKDVNAMNAFIQNNFTKEVVDVHGANNYTTQPYYVYTLKSNIVLGEIDYEIIFKN